MHMHDMYTTPFLSQSLLYDGARMSMHPWSVVGFPFSSANISILCTTNYTKRHCNCSHVRRFFWASKAYAEEGQRRFHQLRASLSPLKRRSWFWVNYYSSNKRWEIISCVLFLEMMIAVIYDTHAIPEKCKPWFLNDVTNSPQFDHFQVELHHSSIASSARILMLKSVSASESFVLFQTLYKWAAYHLQFHKQCT